MNRHIKLFLKTIITIIILIAILISVLSFFKNENGIIDIYGYRPVTIIDDSLRPTINKNDLIIVKDIDSENLKTDDIISYFFYENNQLIIKTGKINKITPTTKATLVFSIKNEEQNKLENIDSSCIIGIWTITIPYIGRIAQYLFTREGFLICIVGPLFIAFIYQLICFINKAAKNKNI